MNRIVEKENRQMKEVLHRNISYDLLRIQAAILVVLLHVSAISWNMISPYKPQWMIINLYNSDNVKIKFTKMDRLIFTNLDRII